MFSLLKPHAPLAFILVVAFLFRIFLMQWRFAIGFDEPHYLQLGAAAALYGWQHLLHPYWPPLYPALVSMLSIFSHDFELAGRLVNVLCGTALLIPAFILAKEMFGKISALLTALLLALFPAIAFSATDALSETSYAFFSLSGLAAGWFALKKRSAWQAAFAGMLFGFCYLTKPEGLGYAGVFLAFSALWLVYRWLRFRNHDLVKVIAAVSGVTFIIALPYLFYLKSATGEWTISGKYKVNRFDVNAINLLSEDNKHLPLDMAYHLGTFSAYDPETHAGDDGHARSVGALAARIAENLYKIFRSELPGAITGPMFLLMALGLFAVHWTWPLAKLNMYLLAYIVFFWLMVIPFFHINARYFAPLLPLCFVWCGRGAVILYDWLRQSLDNVPFAKKIVTRPAIAKVLLAGILVGTSFLPELGKIVSRTETDRDFWDDAVELKEAGAWLQKNTATPPVLMSYNKAADFYAGQYDIRRTATFSFDNIERIVQYALHRGVDYLVLDGRYQSQFPRLESLFAGQAVPQELTPVYDRVSDAGLRVMIYQFNAYSEDDEEKREP